MIILLFYHFIKDHHWFRNTLYKPTWKLAYVWFEPTALSTVGNGVATAKTMTVNLIEYLKIGMSISYWSASEVSP